MGPDTHSNKTACLAVNAFAVNPDRHSRKEDQQHLLRVPNKWLDETAVACGGQQLWRHMGDSAICANVNRLKI